MEDYKQNGYATESEMVLHVVSFLNSKLDSSKKESVKLEVAFEKGSRYYRSDLFLPNGCSALNILPKTIIELKLRLKADTLYGLSQLYKNNKDAWGVNGFIVIYDDKYSFSESVLRRYDNDEIDDSFKVVSLTEFRVDYSKDSDETIPHTESWINKRNRLLNDANHLFKEGHNSLFLGAGLGVAVKMPQWNELLSDLLEEIKDITKSEIGNIDYNNIDDRCNHSSLIVGRFIEQGFQNSDSFKKKMHDSLYKNNPAPDSDLYQELTETIMTGKVDQAITFNYDDLIETSLELRGYSVHSIFDNSHYDGSAFPVYHVHGMIPQNRAIDSTPVLSEREYHRLYKEAYHWSNVVQLFALSRTTCFFVGLSMNDPNLRRLLDISRNGIEVENSSERPCHFAILERKPLTNEITDDKKNLEYYSIQERIMEDLGINIIWFEHKQFNCISKILKYIRTGNSTILQSL